MLKYLVILLCIASIYGFENIANEFVNDVDSGNYIEVDATNDFVTSIVEPHTQPFQVSLEVQEIDILSRRCSGAILNTRAILTSGFCLSNSTSVIILAGVNNRLNFEATQQRRVIFSPNYRIHPEYSAINFTNNIAIIMIQTAFEFNCHVQAVRLPTEFENDTFAGSIARSTNWGGISETNISSHVLLELRNSIMENSQCEQVYSNVPNSFICIETNTSNPSLCEIGTLLTVPRACDARPVLVGIFNFMPPGCSRGLPYVYTRITSFLNWIQENQNP